MFTEPSQLQDLIDQGTVNTPVFLYPEEDSFQNYGQGYHGASHQRIHDHAAFFQPIKNHRRSSSKNSPHYIGISPALARPEDKCLPVTLDRYPAASILAGKGVLIGP
jgi:hypothetical protein